MPDKHASTGPSVDRSLVQAQSKMALSQWSCDEDKVCKHVNAKQNQEVTQHETRVVASFLMRTPP